MQPHYPFIGEFGKKIKQGGIAHQTSDGEQVQTAGEGDIWIKLQFDLIEQGYQEVWDAYAENLRLVLNEVQELLSKIDGLSVVTSDHGNLVGDRIGPFPCKGYGHPPNIYVKELTKVPWLKVDGSRRMVKTDPPDSRTAIDEDIISDRLSSLGYK
jgi:hypothetical protein